MCRADPEDPGRDQGLRHQPRGLPGLAARTGPRASDAAATAAASITRLITISVTSPVTSTGSVATAASFYASCSSRAKPADDA
jgi:hypothetical protein